MKAVIDQVIHEVPSGRGVAKMPHHFPIRNLKRMQSLTIHVDATDDFKQIYKKLSNQAMATKKSQVSKDFTIRTIDRSTIRLWRLK